MPRALRNAVIGVACSPTRASTKFAALSQYVNPWRNRYIVAYLDQPTMRRIEYNIVHAVEALSDFQTHFNKMFCGII